MDSKPIELIRIEEMRIQVPVAALSGGDTGQQDAATFALVFQSWIVRHGDLIVLIDPCTGNGRERPAMPHFHQLDTGYLDRMRAAGVAPEEVDFVFCTHLHCDHCGWNTMRQDGRWVPTFPNARYLFVRQEVDRWGTDRSRHVEMDYNVGVFEDSVLPIIEAGLADFVEHGHEVAPGISIEAAPGHTLGHSIMRIVHTGGSIAFTGDCFHHPLQVADPRLHMDGCDDLDQAIATRRRLCETFARSRTLMVPAHFDAPHMGYVVLKDGRYAFEGQEAPL